MCFSPQFCLLQPIVKAAMYGHEYQSYHGWIKAMIPNTVECDLIGAKVLRVMLEVSTKREIR